MIKKIIILICTIIVLAIAIAIYVVQQPKQELETANKDTYDLEMLKTSDDSTGKSCSNPDKIIEGCKKGETVETVSKEGGFTAKFTCLGVIDDKVVDYKHFKLKNGNVLLYSESNPLKKAKVFDAKTNKFIEVSEDIKTTDYPVYTKKELPENLNLITPRLLFDSDTNKFYKISLFDNLIYYYFELTRKFNKKNIVLIKRFDENKFFYATKNHNSFWIEDPLKLIRYKNGKFKYGKRILSTVALVDGNIAILAKYTLLGTRSRLLDNDTDFTDPEITIYNPYNSIGQNTFIKNNNNKLFLSRGINILFKNHIFIYGYHYGAKIYNTNNEKFNNITVFSKRNRAEMTKLDNEKILITGGQLEHKTPSKFCSNTSELLEINWSVK